MKKDNKVGRFIKGMIDVCPEIDWVPPARAKDDPKYLSVYETSVGSPLGIEYQHKDFVNLWVRKEDITTEMLNDLEHQEKAWQPLPDPTPNDSPWASHNETTGKREGANSNLDSRAWPAFQHHDLLRFRVYCASDAMRVLGEVLRS